MVSINPASAAIRDRYIRFADIEAHGRSQLYEHLARGVADDAEVIAFLLSLPGAKQQPNLLFATVRYLSGTPLDYDDFKARLFSNVDYIRALMLERSTQTNEPARCAALLPILAKLPQPLALIEVGASAGLCLRPDLYGYDYGLGVIRPDASAEAFPVFSCKASPATPIPTDMPRIAWRAGLDLNPLDAANPEQSSWLEALVWPEQQGRLAGLRGALRVAAAQRPWVVQGSLTTVALSMLCQEAPKDATLVVFHTAVLAYVADHAQRQAFANTVTSLCSYWLCNEAPYVLPEVAARAGTPPQADRFLLSVNGSPIAWTEPHGAAIDWIGSPGSL